MSLTSLGWLGANSYVIRAILTVAVYQGFEKILDVLASVLAKSEPKDAAIKAALRRGRAWTCIYGGLAFISALGTIFFYVIAFYVVGGDTELKKLAAFPEEWWGLVAGFYICVPLYLVTQLILHVRGRLG